MRVTFLFLVSLLTTAMVPSHSSSAGISKLRRLVEIPPRRALDIFDPFPRPIFLAPCVSPQTKVLALVFSEPEDAARRHELRNYTKSLANNSVEIRFPLGLSDNRELDFITLAEAAAQRDMIIGEWPDDYKNLGTKFSFGLDYVHNCGDMNPPWIFKHDTDTVVNWRILLSALNQFEGDTNSMKWIGSLFDGSPVIHDPRHKNFEDLPFDWYPPYTSGPHELFSLSAFKFLRDRRQVWTRHMTNDDCLVGILANGTGLKPTHREEFVVFADTAYRVNVCNGKPSTSISECPCQNWWSYHTTSNKPEFDASRSAAIQCVPAT